MCLAPKCYILNTNPFPPLCSATPSGWATCLCNLEEGKRYRSVTCPINRLFRPLCGSDGCSYINDDALACARKDNPREAPTFITSFGTVLFCLSHAILPTLALASILFCLPSFVLACAKNPLKALTFFTSYATSCSVSAMPFSLPLPWLELRRTSMRHLPFPSLSCSSSAMPFFFPLSSLPASEGKTCIYWKILSVSLIIAFPRLLSILTREGNYPRSVINLLFLLPLRPAHEGNSNRYWKSAPDSCLSSSFSPFPASV